VHSRQNHSVCAAPGARKRLYHKWTHKHNWTHKHRHVIHGSMLMLSCAGGQLHPNLSVMRCDEGIIRKHSHSKCLDIHATYATAAAAFSSNYIGRGGRQQQAAAAAASPKPKASPKPAAAAAAGDGDEAEPVGRKSRYVDTIRNTVTAPEDCNDTSVDQLRSTRPNSWALTHAHTNSSPYCREACAQPAC
jgi:hypothetical protein